MEEYQPAELSLQGEATAPSGSRVLQEFGFRESAVIPC
jgi:hypothetical protein